jgi:hypothetical protein
MSNEYERQALCAVERELTAADPAFISFLRCAQQRLRAAKRPVTSASCFWRCSPSRC